MTTANATLATQPIEATLARSFVRVAFWPLYFLGVFGAMVWADASGQQDLVRGSLALGTLLGVMLLEQILAKSEAGGVRGDPQLRYDIGFFIGNTLIEMLFIGALFLAALWAGSQLAGLLGTSIWPTHWAWPAQVVLAFLAADFIDYWVHRCSHRVPWLWSMHVHHHDTQRLHVFKGARNHPFATLVRIVGTYVPLLVLGAPPMLLFWFQTYIVSIGSVAHANLDMKFPAWLNRVLVTPAVHRVHHASAHALHDRNFGALTPIWDIVLGTYEAPEAHSALEYGVGEARLRGGFFRQLAWPFVWWRQSPR